MGDTPIYYVTDGEAFERVGVAGANESSHGRYTELMPKISRKDFDILMAVQGDTEHGVLEAALERVPGLTEQSRDHFSRTRRAMRYVDSEGVTSVHLVPDLPRAMRDYDVPVTPSAQQAVPVYDEEDRTVKVRKYSLLQFFTDPDVIAKYALPRKVLETVKRAAASKPDNAAAILQAAIMDREPPHQVRVVAGDYSRSKVNAKNAVRLLSAGIPDTTNTISSMVIGERILMFGPGGEEDWFVQGPLQHSYEVKDVYRMVTRMGTFEPIFLLGLETSILQIDVYNGQRFESPEITYHAASTGSPPLPNRSSMESTSMMSIDTRSRLESMVDRILPVESEDGLVASAVRISDRHVLVNSHVVTGMLGGLKIDGQPFNLMKSMSRDVWAAKLKGKAESWVLREPDIGEMVVLCYRVGDNVRFTSPMTVQRCVDDVMRLSLASDVEPGMSGAAVVALTDLALLGVHSAVTRTDAIAYHFGNAQFNELLEADLVSQVSHDSASDDVADSILSHFTRRGLGTIVKTAIRSMIPIYVGEEYRGCAINLGEKVATTCDPDLPLRLGTQRQPAIFSTVPGRMQYMADMVFPNQPVPTLVRRPAYYESVYVIGKDDQGPFFSGESRVIHIGTDARVFTIASIDEEGYTLKGGIIVAKSDGAVLGQCGHTTTTVSVGFGIVCYPVQIAHKVIANESPESLLQRKFPFLNVQFWPTGLVEEVVTHSSAGAYRESNLAFNAGARPLANIGDNIAKAALYEKLREDKVDHAQWQTVMQTLQSNITYSKLAEDFEYGKLLRTGGGVTFPAGSKAYADMTEALIGAVYLAETRDTLRKFVETLGVIGKLPVSPTEAVPVSRLRISEPG